MAELDPPRTREQRRKDTLRRLEQDVDAWVATSGADGPCMVPLSYLWDGSSLLIATSAATPTARNLLADGAVRIGIGPTRDVVLIQGTARPTEVDADLGDRFAAATGFDPRELSGYRYFRVRPERVQAWREVNELPGRDLMREGRWLT
jgi:Pyridoxamine 5'-phosphate oxidase